MISSFTGQYSFLSNFYIEPDGTHVEGEYQAQKSDPPAEYLLKMPPGQAKRVGKTLKLRPDWDLVKVETMKLLVWQKFVDHPDLASKLHATRGHVLVEGNSWGDTFWGKCGGVGENQLGRILMWVRWMRV